MSFEMPPCARSLPAASSRTSAFASSKHWRTSSTHASFSIVTQFVCDLYSRVSSSISESIARFTLT